MPVIDAELKYYAATVVNDSNSNGGRLSSVQSISGVTSNLFPNATPSERLSGLIRYRKLFLKVANNTALALLNSLFFMDKNTAGDDKVTFFPTTQRSTQSAITGAERLYGCGTLQTTVSAGVTTVNVVVEDGTAILFVNGDTVRITDKPDIASAGNEQYLILSAAPTVLGNVVTLTFTTTPLLYGFLSASTRLASIYKQASIVALFDNFSVTSSAGTYNTTTAPVLLNGIGTVEQTWTLTFTSASAYNISGDTLGAIGSGNTSGGAAPVNADFSQVYFTLASAGFGGTFVAGDTIVFQSHPAALALFVREVIPAACNVIAANTAVFGAYGESA